MWPLLKKLLIWDKSIRCICDSKLRGDDWKYAWFNEDDTYIDEKFNQIINNMNNNIQDIDLLLFGWHKMYMTVNNDWDH